MANYLKKFLLGPMQDESRGGKPRRVPQVYPPINPVAVTGGRKPPGFGGQGVPISPKIMTQESKLQDAPLMTADQWGTRYAPPTPEIANTMKGYLSEARPPVQTQTPEPPGDLMSRLEQILSSQPQMPGQRPAPMAMPERPRQNLLDVIPQLLAGAGDVLGARYGRQQGHLAGVMGQQAGMRNQQYEDRMRAAQAQQMGQQGAYEDQWRRYGAQAQQGQSKIGQMLAVGGFGQKQQEMEMQKALFDKMLEKQKSEASQPSALANSYYQTYKAEDDPKKRDALRAKTQAGIVAQYGKDPAALKREMEAEAAAFGEAERGEGATESQSWYRAGYAPTPFMPYTAPAAGIADILRALGIVDLSPTNRAAYIAK